MAGESGFGLEGELLAIAFSYTTAFFFLSGWKERAGSGLRANYLLLLFFGLFFFGGGFNRMMAQEGAGSGLKAQSFLRNLCALTKCLRIRFFFFYPPPDFFFCFLDLRN